MSSLGVILHGRTAVESARSFCSSLRFRITSPPVVHVDQRFGGLHSPIPIRQAAQCDARGSAPDFDLPVFDRCLCWNGQGDRMEPDRVRERPRALIIEGDQTKNEDPLLRSLPTGLAAVLKKLPRQDRVFSAKNLRKAFQAACIKIGLGTKTVLNIWQYKGLLIHDLRRSGVRNLIRSGVPRAIAMKISGYLTESTFVWTRRICTMRSRRLKSTSMEV